MVIDEEFTDEGTNSRSQIESVVLFDGLFGHPFAEWFKVCSQVQITTAAMQPDVLKELR